MNLSDAAKHVITTALADRRIELQRRVNFWKADATLRGATGECTSEFAGKADANLAELDAVLRELDRGLIPWLHHHPDICDLFVAEESSDTVPTTATDESKQFSYEVAPRDAAIGGGWRLRLFDNGEEVGGGAFPAEEGPDENEAYFEATNEGEEWLLAQVLKSGVVPARSNYGCAAPPASQPTAEKVEGKSVIIHENSLGKD